MRVFDHQFVCRAAEFQCPSSFIVIEIFVQHAALWPGGKAGLDRAFLWVLRTTENFADQSNHKVSANSRQFQKMIFPYNPVWPE